MLPHALVYNLNRITVCKRFFRHATGLSYELIQGAEGFVLGKESYSHDAWIRLARTNKFQARCKGLTSMITPLPIIDRVKRSLNIRENVKTSIKVHFRGLCGDIDHIPELHGLKFTRENWNEIYIKYKYRCQELDLPSASYPTFVKYRYSLTAILLRTFSNL